MRPPSIEWCTQLYQKLNQLPLHHNWPLRSLLNQLYPFLDSIKLEAIIKDSPAFLFLLLLLLLLLLMHTMRDHNPKEVKRTQWEMLLIWLLLRFFFFVWGKKTTRTTDIIININNTQRKLRAEKQCKNLTEMLDTHPLYFLSLSLALFLCSWNYYRCSYIYLFFLVSLLSLQLHAIEFSSPVSLIVGQRSHNATNFFCCIKIQVHSFLYLIYYFWLLVCCFIFRLLFFSLTLKTAAFVIHSNISCSLLQHKIAYMFYLSCMNCGNVLTHWANFFFFFNRNSNKNAAMKKKIIKWK